MFTVEKRDRVQEQLLAQAEADSAIAGAAVTGSLASGDSDRWSDTDLVLAVHGELSPVVKRWTRWLCHELGARHHWDLPAGARITRVFLLPGWLEVDLTFTPEEEFGPRARSGGPSSARRGRSSPSRHPALTAELGQSDPGLATRLRPMLAELATPADGGRQ